MNKSSSSSPAKRQFGKNAFSNLSMYVVNLLIGLFYTPFLIKNLGVSSYGLVPLTSSITSYLGLLTLSLNGAVGRFLLIDLQHDDIEAANRTFNTSLFGSVLICVLIFPLIIGFVFASPRIFNFPSGEETSSKLLFFFVMVSFLVTTIESCFSVSTWVKKRFDLRNVVVASTNIFRILLVVLFFHILRPSVWQVGISILISTFLGFMGDGFLWKKLTPNLSVNLKKFDRLRVHQLFEMGGWLTLNQIGSLLFLNIDLIIANIVLGAKVAGEYGSILIFSQSIRNLGGTISNVLIPTIVENFAKGKMENMTRISAQAVRLLGIAVGFSVGLLSGLGKPFLGLWLGEEFSTLWTLLVLLIIHLPINLAVFPLFGVQQAMNKVKIPGIVTLIMGILNLALALLFTICFHWGAIGIAAASAVALTMKNTLFTPIYTAYIQKISRFTYMRSMVPGIIVTIVTGISAYFASILINLSNWSLFISVGSVLGIVGLTIIYFFGLKQEDRSLLTSYIPAFNRSNINH